MRNIMRHIPYFYDQPGDAGEEITRNSDSLKAMNTRHNLDHNICYRQN